LASFSEEPTSLSGLGGGGAWRTGSAPAGRLGGGGTGGGTGGAARVGPPISSFAVYDVVVSSTGLLMRGRAVDEGFAGGRAGGTALATPGLGRGLLIPLTAGNRSGCFCVGGGGLSGKTGGAGFGGRGEAWLVASPASACDVGDLMEGVLRLPMRLIWRLEEKLPPLLAGGDWPGVSGRASSDVWVPSDEMVPELTRMPEPPLHELCPMEMLWRLRCAIPLPFLRSQNQNEKGSNTQ